MIRKFKKSDAKQCADIINTCHKRMPEFSKKKLEFLLSKYTSEYIASEYPKHYVLVFEANGKIIGVGSLMGSEIRGLYIDPKSHSKGCGSAILEGLEKKAKSIGLKKVHTLSYYGPESFYKLKGYKFIKNGTAERGELRFKYKLMEKEL